MDPASAIGVASAVLTFVDFSTEIIRGAFHIYSNVDDASEWQEPGYVAFKMESLANRLRRPPNFGSAPGEQEIADLADRCHTLAQQLVVLFKSLQPKDRKSRRQCLWAATKMQLKESEVNELGKKLDDCRVQLQFHLLHSDYLNGQDMKNALKGIVSIQNDDSQKLRSLHANVESLKTAVGHVANGVEVPCLSQQALEQLRRALDLHSSTLDAIATSKILQSLAFDGMDARYELIDDAHKDTFNWMLEEDVHHQLQPPQIAAKELFNNWLSSETGIFHISGKLGSGKSTMLKFMVDHPQTLKSLQTWAGDNRLVFASFFFWKPGTKQQKSLSGLYRSLLRSSLKAMPSLIPHVLPSYWQTAKTAPWQAHVSMEMTDKEIRSAFALLVNAKSQQPLYSYCFFIDGLDEYEETTREDHGDLVNLIRTWAQSSAQNVKFCISSREYNVYMNAFSESRRIRIHKLTGHDREAYVTERLSQISSSPNFSELVGEICRRSNGIFLWVTLVVREIRYQLDNGTAPEHMEQQLDFLPEELEDLYYYILNKLLRPEEKQMAFRTFELMALLDGYDNKLLLWEHSFLSEFVENPDSFTAMANSARIALGLHEAEQRMKTARQRLVACCRGLVEVDDSHGLHSQSALGQDTYEQPLTYVHRSFPDFLANTKMEKVAADTLIKFNSVDAFSRLLLGGLWSLGQEPVCGGAWNRHLSLVTLIRYNRQGNHDRYPPFEFFVELEDPTAPWTSSLLPRSTANRIITSSMMLGASRRSKAELFGIDSRSDSTPWDGPTSAVLSSPALVLAFSDTSHPYIAWKLTHASDREWNLRLGVFLVYGTLVKIGIKVTGGGEPDPVDYAFLRTILAHSILRSHLVTDWFPEQLIEPAYRFGTSTGLPVWATVMMDWSMNHVIHPWLANSGVLLYPSMSGCEEQVRLHWSKVLEIFFESSEFDGRFEVLVPLEPASNVMVEFVIGENKRTAYSYLYHIGLIPTAAPGMVKLPAPSIGGMDKSYTRWDLQNLIEEYDPPNKETLLSLLEGRRSTCRSL